MEGLTSRFVFFIVFFCFFSWDMPSSGFYCPVCQKNKWQVQYVTRPPSSWEHPQTPRKTPPSWRLIAVGSSMVFLSLNVVLKWMALNAPGLVKIISSAFLVFSVMLLIGVLMICKQAVASMLKNQKYRSIQCTHCQGMHRVLMAQKTAETSKASKKNQDPLFNAHCCGTPRVRLSFEEASCSEAEKKALKAKNKKSGLIFLLWGVPLCVLIGGAAYQAGGAYNAMSCLLILLAFVRFKPHDPPARCQLECERCHTRSDVANPLNIKP